MSSTPAAAQSAPGVADFNMPMVPYSVRIRIAWLKKLKSIAATRGPDCDASKLIREALALWADENGIDLNGFTF